MRGLGQASVSDIIDVYSGPERQLWELLMGEQIHIGGFASSARLADLAGIRPGSCGIDLCCCTGAGMRFLVHYRAVARMTGVDVTPDVIEIGEMRCRSENLSANISFLLADSIDSGLPSEEADFVWGEDAWCYVSDKAALVADAARLVRPQGTIAFTDWVEGPMPMTDSELEWFLGFMKFPNLGTIADYRNTLAMSGCHVTHAEYTDLYAPCVDLYLSMLEHQHAYDALKILGNSQSALEELVGALRKVSELAHAGKIAQAMFVAQKTG